MRTTRVAAWAGLALATVVGLAAVRRAAGADDDLDAVTKQCKAFKAGWNSHDPKAMAAVFAEDGDAIDPMGRKAVGRAAEAPEWSTFSLTRFRPTCSLIEQSNGATGRARA